MFTFNFLKSSLLNGVNLNRSLAVANTRSLQLFRRPNEIKKEKDEDEDLDFAPEKITLESVDGEIEDPEIVNQRLDEIRNKSRLRPQHRNMLLDRLPYERSESWIHETIKYKRLMYGRFGKESGVDPSE
jgi:hypothetical protein